MHENPAAVSAVRFLAKYTLRFSDQKERKPSERAAGESNLSLRPIPRINHRIEPTNRPRGGNHPRPYTLSAAFRREDYIARRSERSPVVCGFISPPPSSPPHPPNTRKPPTAVSAVRFAPSISRVPAEKKEPFGFEIPSEVLPPGP